jgi:hypothetical protein
MPRDRIPGLPRDEGGVVQVGSAEEPGTVNGHEWDSVFRTWRVHVALDQPAGIRKPR